MSRKLAHTAFLNSRDITEELYSSIKNGFYAHAVEVSANISESGHDAIISAVVERLALDNNKNLLSYIYRLWTGDTRVIMERMPEPYKSVFKSIFNQEDIILVQKKYGSALKLDDYLDSDGDRKAWGDSADKTSKGVIWKILPSWENNRILFRIKNMDCNMYLKLEVMQQTNGDRRAYGAVNYTAMRHLWFFEPVVINGEILFYIMNRPFSHALKLIGNSNCKDMAVWGHSGGVYGDPDRFAWYIRNRLIVNDEL